MLKILEQFLIFLETIALGWGAGIFFDFYRVLRSFWQPRKLGTFIGDIFFCVLLTSLIYGGLLLGNWGEVRIYVFIGLFIGGSLYFKFLSTKIQRYVRLVYIYLHKAGKLILFPFGLIKNILIFPFSLLYKIRKAIVQKIKMKSLNRRK